MQFYSPVEIENRIQNEGLLSILDVGEYYELTICKINSMYIPMREIISRIFEIPEDKEVVVLCQTGKRAMAVANLLRTNYNLMNINVLDGGVMKWIDQLDTN